MYLDDILLVGVSPAQVQKQIKSMVDDLQNAGMTINTKKSQLLPSQQVEHLGFTINFKDGVLQVPEDKLKSIRREMGKLLTHSFMSCRKMAAILGAIRAFLMAMPFLRAFSDKLVQFVKQEKRYGWDLKLKVPQDVQDQIRQMKTIMEQWRGRVFQGKAPVRFLHSDSSQEAWAGVDVHSGQIIQEFWRNKRGLHINVKELEAAINTVRSLAKPGEKVELSVDNSVTFYYLKKGGGKIPSLNDQIRPFLEWCIKNDIQLDVQLVKSSEDLADGPSRWSKDRGDYTLNRKLFHHLTFLMRNYITPDIDIFASPGNHQLPKFVTRYPHWQATEVDALKCPLANVAHCYANPPWKIITPWLHRLREHKHVKCLLITPHWPSSPWWPLITKMQVRGTPTIQIAPFWGMFANCWGEPMPPPHWPLICTVVSGQAWRANKATLKKWIQI